MDTLFYEGTNLRKISICFLAYTGKKVIKNNDENAVKYLCTGLIRAVRNSRPSY